MGKQHLYVKLNKLHSELTLHVPFSVSAMLHNLNIHITSSCVQLIRTTVRALQRSTRTSADCRELLPEMVYNWKICTTVCTIIDTSSKMKIPLQDMHPSFSLPCKLGGSYLNCSAQLWKTYYMNIKRWNYKINRILWGGGGQKSCQMP